MIFVTDALTIILSCHLSVSKRWWLCQKTLQNMYEIDDQVKVSFNFGMVPHLYRCPNGYHFDTTSRRCRKKDIAKCGTNWSTKSRFEDLGLLQLLFP